MKSKDKTKKNVKISLKSIIYFLAFIISLLYLIIFYDRYFAKNKVYAKETNSNIKNVKISNAKALTTNDIIGNITNKNKKEEYYVQEVELEYITKYRNNPNLAKNTIQVVQEGREGKQQITIKREYENDEIIKEEQESIKITKAAIDKIVEIGTGNNIKQYKVKTGDFVYVTSDRLSVMSEANENSQKVATLEKDSQLKVLQIQNEWYKIICGSVEGYIKAESTTPINKQAEINQKTTNKDGKENQN